MPNSSDYSRWSKERFTKKKIIGMALIIFGILFFSLGGMIFGG